MNSMPARCKAVWSAFTASLETNLRSFSKSTTVDQIEEAIARIFAPKSEEPPSELLMRIKRLLDLDRSIGRKPRSKDAEEANFGFFSAEASGTEPILHSRNMKHSPC